MGGGQPRVAAACGFALAVGGALQLQLDLGVGVSGGAGEREHQRRPEGEQKGERYGDWDHERHGPSLNAETFAGGPDGSSPRAAAVLQRRL